MLLVSYEFGAFLIILAALYYVVPDRFSGLCFWRSAICSTLGAA